MATPANRYDVFLCHHEPDGAAVQELARQLVKEGIQPWFDGWNLIPGDPYQEAVEDALDLCECVAVFVGPSGIGPWQHEQMRVSIQRRVDARRSGQRRFRVIPVLLPGAERGSAADCLTFLSRLLGSSFVIGWRMSRPSTV